MNKEKQGQLTGIVGRRLCERLADRGLEVLYDHGITGDKGVGELSVWYGEWYRADTRLAVMDIAVVDPKTDCALMLVEVEESTSPPKTVIGDIFAALLGDGVRFQGERVLQVDEGTLLLVVVYGEGKAMHDRLAYLEAQANAVKGGMTSGNARIGNVVLRSFEGEQDLEQLLFREMESWMETR